MTDKQPRQNTGNHPDQLTGIVAEFQRCLGTMSYSRAGWDYQLPIAQRAEEDRRERESLSRARDIWAHNPDLHEKLQEAFAAAKPLGTMSEIERK